MKKPISGVCLIVLISGIISISMGNGWIVPDDYDNLQDAITAALNDPGYNDIYLRNYPTVYYEVVDNQDQIEIHYDDGGLLIRALYTDKTLPVIYIDDTYMVALYINRSSNINISYIEFRNYDNDNNTKAIQVKNCQDIHILNNNFYDYSNRSDNTAIETFIYESNPGPKHIEIRHNIISDFDYGIYVTDNWISGNWGENDYTNNSITTYKKAIHWNQRAGWQKPRFWTNECIGQDEAVYAKRYGGTLYFSTNVDGFYIWDQSDTYVLTSDGSFCTLYHSNNYYEWCYDRLRPINGGTLSYLGGDSWRRCPDR